MTHPLTDFSALAAPIVERQAPSAPALPSFRMSCLTRTQIQCMLTISSAPRPTGGPGGFPGFPSGPGGFRESGV
jgi:hypothetical protein